MGEYLHVAVISSTQTSERHVMDGHTPKDRLELLEPVCEDWHALVKVSVP